MAITKAQHLHLPLTTCSITLACVTPPLTTCAVSHACPHTIPPLTTHFLAQIPPFPIYTPPRPNTTPPLTTHHLPIHLPALHSGRLNTPPLTTHHMPTCHPCPAQRQAGRPSGWPTHRLHHHPRHHCRRLRPPHSHPLPCHHHSRWKRRPREYSRFRKYSRTRPGRGTRGGRL